MMLLRCQADAYAMSDLCLPMALHTAYFVLQTPNCGLRSSDCGLRSAHLVLPHIYIAGLDACEVEAEEAHTQNFRA
jgi:hypothetical protein